jgi:hypothetical protein
MLNHSITSPAHTQDQPRIWRFNSRLSRESFAWRGSHLRTKVSPRHVKVSKCVSQSCSARKMANWIALSLLFHRLPVETWISNVRVMLLCVESAE